MRIAYFLAEQRNVKVLALKLLSLSCNHVSIKVGQLVFSIFVDEAGSGTFLTLNK